MKLNKWALGLLIAAFVAGIATAQTVVTNGLTGNEVVLFQAGGPGGTGGYTTTAALRAAPIHQLIPGGGTVNTSIAANVQLAIPQSAITTWNIEFPDPPNYGGQTFGVTCPIAQATTVSMVTAKVTPVITITGSAYTTCPIGGSISNGAEWTYSPSDVTWLRIR